MYPVMLNLKGKKILIVGGGKIALRKVQGLIGEQADITLIAPDVLTEIRQYDIHIKIEPFNETNIDAFDFIFIATDDNHTNQRIIQMVQPYQWINDCTDQSNSNFFNVASIRNEDYRIMISTDGKSPQKSKALKQQLKEMLNQIQ